MTLTINSDMNNNRRFMALINAESAPTEYISFVAEKNYYIATDEFLRDISVMTDTKFKATYMEKETANIYNYADAEMKKFISGTTGAISDNESYFISNFIAVDGGKTVYFYARNPVNDSFNTKYARSVCCYDANKTVINGGTNTQVLSLPVPSECKFIRISVLYQSQNPSSYPENLMVTQTSNPSGYMDYTENVSYLFKKEYLPISETNLHVYLPPEICVGIGRTIELYNNLVCLEAEKYHIHWSCSVGIAYARKYSITGTSTGTYALTLQIYNDNLEIVWRGSSVVKVVANNISSELKIVPIGDSLTNIKPWLSEVQTLSDSKIKYIGTRGRNDSTIRHEGRSGADSAGYNSQFEYTFDALYQGNPSLSGTANPFWDGSKFSLQYYISNQASYIGTPDAVQIFLGTNSIALDPTTNVSNIKALVDNIRNEFPTMPIFVCNTIYRSNQNGYYSTGADGYHSASDWQYNADMKVMNLQNALADALDGYTNVYIVPLSVCMDRENDFGQVEVAVNPRLTTVTEYIPNESVHPQNAGYMQMADVMYSSYIAHLS